LKRFTGSSRISGIFGEGVFRGQPGPQAYGRSHADGANMLAEALRPHGGL